MKLSFLVALAGVALAAPAHAADLTVDLDGVRGGGGTLYVTVQTRDQFMQETGTAGSVVSLPRQGSHRFSFAVPPGEYAVSVWHDDNGNRRFDKGEDHRPLDGWALTNGEALRGEPTFDQVRLQVGESAAVRLSMTYGR